MLTTCQQIDASWRRPDISNIAAGVDGLGCTDRRLAGSLGMSASPSLVSLSRTTGATSRVIAWSIAAWLLVLSCLPKVAGLIVDMPRPVMAAALFQRFVDLVAGVQVAVAAELTLASPLSIGFSILALRRPFIPFDGQRCATGHGMHWIDHFRSGGRGGHLALFLLGSWRYGRVRLGADRRTRRRLLRRRGRGREDVDDVRRVAPSSTPRSTRSGAVGPIDMRSRATIDVRASLRRPAVPT